MPFSEILGQERAVARLRQAWAGGRLAQAYCFAGPAGVGKRLAAVALAQAVNCIAARGPQDTRDACGTCLPCRKIGTGIHPDVVLVQPDEKTVITVEQIREVAARAALRPYEATTKVWIVDPADQMQEPAANAFLKTLEEPSGRSLFILLATAAGALLPTIRSRCQEVPFAPLGVRDLEALLVRQGRAPAEAAAAAALAGGSAATALALDPAEAAEARERMLRDLWEALDSLPGLLEQAERLARDRATLEAALVVLAGQARELALAKVGAARLLPAARREAALERAAGLPLPAILAIDDAQAEAQRALARNANVRFTAERMLLRMQRAIGGSGGWKGSA